MSAITFPKEFPYVAASLVTTPVLLLWQTFLVARQRKRAEIKYPQLYAEKAEAAESLEAQKFNCVQRAHQNTLEVMPIVVVTTLVTGLKYPVFSAIACGIFSLTRIPYTLGYASGIPKKRSSNGASIGTAAALLLTLASIGVVGTWILELV